MAQIPAFPGAQGFGGHATGGRGGDVYTVTNLNSNGAGSLRYGIETAPTQGRTIVFAVSGYIPINYNSDTGNQSLRIVRNKVTIAGQTAPGDGIGLKDGRLLLTGNNAIVRHLRIRHGKYGGAGDCVNVESSADDCILDHVSLMFSTDENISFFNNTVDDFTMQYSTSSWGMERHNAGGLWDLEKGSCHHSLWAHHRTRNPKARPYGLLEWINNVTYHWRTEGFIMGDSQSNVDWYANVRGCYFLSIADNQFGLDNTALSKARIGNNGQPNFHLYLDDCLHDADGDGLLNGTDKGYGIVAGSPYPSAGTTPGTVSYDQSPTPFPGASGAVTVTIDDPLTAYKKVISSSGALRLDATHSGPLRDELDELLIESVENQESILVAKDTPVNADDPPSNGEAQLAGAPYHISNNGFGTLNSTPAPADSDGDGMPDVWEETLGWNPFAQDHNTAMASSGGSLSGLTFFPTGTPAGYTRLEEYLHFRAIPHAMIPPNGAGGSSSLVVDLGRYTRGFDVAPVSFAISGVSNGSVVLQGDGRTAVFTPTYGFSGRAKFDFTVSDGDGSSWTQTLGVLVTGEPAGLPDPPSGLAAVPAVGEVALTWNEVSASQSYQVKRSAGSGGPYTVIATVTEEGYFDTGLGADTTWYYVVSSVNSAGEGTNSSEVAGTVPGDGGGQPNALQVEAGNFGGDVLFASNNGGWYGSGFLNFPMTGGWLEMDGIDGAWGGTGTLSIRYALGAAGSRTGNLVVNGVSQSITFPSTGSWTTWVTMELPVDLVAGTGNVIRFESNGEDLANLDEILVTPPPPPAPAAPGGVVARGGDGRVAVSWDPVAGADSYEIRRSATAGGPFTSVGSNPYTTSFLDTAVSNGTTYHYVVSASGPGGTGADSAGVSAAASGSGSVTLQAEDSAMSGGTVGSTNTAGYFGSGYANYPVTGGTTTFTGVHGGSGGTAQLVIRYGLTGTDARTGSLSVNGSSQSITFPATDAWENWSVLSLGITLNPGATNTIVLASTGEDLGSVDEITVFPAGGVVLPPDAPSGLMAVAGNGQVSLSWNESEGAESYLVKRSTTSGGPYATVASPGSTGFVDGGLTNGTTYHYVVSASNASGEGAESGEVASTPVGSLAVYEGFGYGAGVNLSGQSGGSGWGLPWSSVAIDDAVNQAASLGYGFLETSGGACQFGGNPGSTTVFTRKFPSSLGSTGGTVWMSLLYLNNGSTTAEARFGLYGGMGPDANGNTATSSGGLPHPVDFGRPPTSTGAADEIHLYDSAGTLVSSGVATPRGSEPALLLLRFDLSGNPGTQDTLHLWVNPDLGLGESGLGSPQATWANSSDLEVIDGMRFQQSAGGSVLVDEIRVGASYESVTPLVVGPVTLQAEEMVSWGGGVSMDSNNPGWNGSGFANFGMSGSYLDFTPIDGGAGGSHLMSIRHALGASGSRTGNLVVNGVAESLTFQPTGSWTTWTTVEVPVTLAAGTGNTIRFETTGQDLANIDEITLVPGSGGGSGSLATVTAPDSGDRDGDGVADLVELFLGTDPADGSSHAGLSLVSGEGGAVQVRYSRSRLLDAPGGRLEWSTDLKSWQASGESDGVRVVTLKERTVSTQDGPTEEVEASVVVVGDTPPPALFLRLAVE